MAPTRTDPTKAPSGHDNLKILPHIPPLDPDSPITEEDYLVLKERVLEKLERMGLTDLRKHIVVEDTLTLRHRADGYSNRGSIMVWLQTGKRTGSRSEKARTQESLFHGECVNPGGMPMVILRGQKGQTGLPRLTWQFGSQWLNVSPSGSVALTIVTQG